MAQWLKVSTAVTIRLGPFIDRTDGYTEETGLAGAGTEISKNHVAFSAGPTLGTHDAEGWYPLALTGTHTDTIGPFIVKSHDNTTHLPVWKEFMVVAGNIYDSLVDGAVTFPAATLASTTNITAGTITTATNVTTVNGLAANVITATSINADAVTEIVDGIWDELTADARTAGSYGQLLKDDINATISSRATQTSVDTIDNFVDTEIADIQARLPAALVSGRMDSSVGAMAADTVTASAIAADAIGSSELAASAATEIADALLNRDMSAVSDTNSRTPLNALRFLRNKWSIAAGTLTVTEEDDTTSAWTATLTSDAAADPIIGSDPA